MEVQWEPLGGGVGVYRSPAVSFTTDALLLARFAQPRPGEACADLGTGCGILPILWRSRGANGQILAVELQEEAAVLARRSVAENGYEDSITVLRGDVRDYRALLPHQGLDRIACNPPYYPEGTGGPGTLARHDRTLTLENLRDAARFTLKDGGRLCVCLPAVRLAEALHLFREGGLEPKRLRLVQSGPEKEPYLFLLECRKAGHRGLSVERNLILNTADGRPTQELLEIYGDYVHE